jgi:hypothetical protein
MQGSFLAEIQHAIKENRLRYTFHAQEQMAKRHILHAEICECLLSAEVDVIEEYHDDKYSPSVLIYGITQKRRILHIQSNRTGVIITTYEPDQERWHQDKKTRRRV